MIRFISAFCFAFAHSQEIFPLAAPVSLLFFTAANIFPRMDFGEFRRPDFLLGCVLLCYTIAVAFTQCGELIVENGIGYFAGAGRATYAIVLFLAIRLANSSSRQAVDDLLKSSLYVGSSIAAYSICCFFLGPVMIGEVNTGANVAEGGKFAVGFLGSKNSFGGSVGGTLVLAIGLLTIKPSYNLVHRYLVYSCCFVLLPALVLSASRGYFLGFMAAIFVAFVAFSKTERQSKKRLLNKLLLGLTIIFASVLIFVFANPESSGRLISGKDKNVQRRIALFRYTAECFTRSSLVGVGPGAISQANLRLRPVIPFVYSQRIGGEVEEEGIVWVGDLPLGQHSHNILLQFLVDYGLIGLGLLIVLVALNLRGRLPSTTESELWRKRAAATMLVYLIVAGAGAGYTLTSVSIAWVFWGLLAGCKGRLRNS